MEAFANDISADACCNLFSWHRNNEQGLWLAENQEDEHISRKRTFHPWVTYESDDDSSIDDVESVKTVRQDVIEDWLDVTNSFVSKAGRANSESH